MKCGNIWLGQKYLPSGETITLNLQAYVSSWSFLLALLYPGGWSESLSPKVLAIPIHYREGFSAELGTNLYRPLQIRYDGAECLPPFFEQGTHSLTCVQKKNTRK